MVTKKFGPGTPTYRIMNTLASVLDETFNDELKGKDRHTGFCLMVFPFHGDQESVANYVSNANRDDMLAMLKKLVERFEADSNPQSNQGDDSGS
ncbi:MAG: hypothetical protein ACJ8CB_17465 [Ktedonobacteraceae bacterium]